MCRLDNTNGLSFRKVSVAEHRQRQVLPWPIFTPASFESFRWQKPGDSQQRRTRGEWVRYDSGCDAPIDLILKSRWNKTKQQLNGYIWMARHGLAYERKIRDCQLLECQ